MNTSIKYIKLADFLNTIETPEVITKIAVKEYSCSIGEIDKLVTEFRSLINEREADKVVNAFMIGIKLQTLLNRQIRVLNLILEHATCKSCCSSDVTTADLLSLNVYLSDIKRHLDEALCPIRDKLIVSLDDYELNMGYDYGPENEELEDMEQGSLLM